MSDSRVFIVLATCQGEAFLPELLASLRGQSYEDWTLLVRDDQSGDATRRILEETAAVDRRMVLMENDSRRLGAKDNFARLLQEAHGQGAGYVLLADQDDVWHKNKVARQVQALSASCPPPAGSAAETAAPRPRLVFCDAKVIDAAGRPLYASFLRHNCLPYQSERPLTTLLGRSFVLGCACAVNRALLDLALPLPEEIASHDWWLALCAAASGQITCLDVPLLDYRRHAANASQWAIWNVFRNLGGWRRRWRIGWDHFQRSLAQARALRDRLHQRQMGTRRPDRIPAQGASEALTASEVKVRSVANASGYTEGGPAELLELFCRVVDEPSRCRRLRQLHRLGVPEIGRLRRALYDVCMLMR